MVDGVDWLVFFISELEVEMGRDVAAITGIPNHVSLSHRKQIRRRISIYGKLSRFKLLFAHPPFDLLAEFTQVTINGNISIAQGKIYCPPVPKR